MFVLRMLFGGCGNGDGGGGSSSSSMHFQYT